MSAPKSNPPMDPPPDKKRKTRLEGEEEKTSEEDWGDDEYTVDDINFILSQAELMPEDSTRYCHSSMLDQQDASQTAASTSFETSTFSRTPSRSRGLHVFTRHHGRQPGFRGLGASFSSRPIGEFPDDLQKYLQEKEQQVSEYQAQLIHLKDELTAREGEVALQRETIEKKESEILKYRNEKMGQMEVERRERSIIEKQLEMEVEKLRSQVQFREHEVAEFVNKCCVLEQKIANLEGISPSPEKLSTQQPRVLPVKRKSPLKSPSGYPTIDSFHGRDLPESDDKNDSCTSPDDTDAEIVSELSSRSARNHKFTSTVSNSEVNGPYLGSRLLVGSTNISAGLLKLLTPRSQTPVNLTTVYLERDGGKLLFSPKHMKRSNSQQRPTSKSQAYAESPGKSLEDNSEKNLSLATVGLTSLLTGQYSGEELGCFWGCSSDDEVEDIVEIHSAIFLLPLIEDCLQEYSQMLNNTDGDSFSSPRTYSGPLGLESGSSPFYSFTSSLNCLMREGATYANNLEEVTMAALNVLFELVCHCPDVGDWILSRGSEENILASAKDEADKQEEAEGTSTEEQNVPVSSTKHYPTCSSDFAGVQILYLLAKLAECGIDSSFVHRQSVVEMCLDILYQLALQSTVKQVESLSTVVTLCRIHTCLVPGVSTSIIRRALKLVTQLVKSGVLLRSFCTASDGCVWMSIYGLCARKIPFEDQCSMFSSILECMSNAVSRRKQGISKLLYSSCVCNSELPKAVTVLMMTILEEYLRSRCEETFALIERGVALLYVLNQSDIRISDRQDDTIHIYVALLSALVDIYKEMPDSPGKESSSLNELWELIQDDGNQDSQGLSA